MSGAQIAHEQHKKPSACFGSMSCRAGVAAWSMKSLAATCSIYSTALSTAARQSPPTGCLRPSVSSSIGVLHATSLLPPPCAGVKPPTAERARDRVLSDEELRLVWQAADKLGGAFAPLVKLLALTGQRRDEVARMRWEEVGIENRLWTLPAERTKNNQPHEVPLSNAALAILEKVPRVKESPFVLTTNGGASPASGYSKNKRRLDALLPLDMPPWRLHDLRRTCASGMARLGINLPVIEKVLNHASGSFAGIVGVYQRHSFADEKRAALEAWGRHVEGLISGKPAGKVVRLSEKRR
jgi:integrase